MISYVNSSYVLGSSAIWRNAISVNKNGKRDRELVYRCHGELCARLDL